MLVGFLMSFAILIAIAVLGVGVAAMGDGPPRNDTGFPIIATMFYLGVGVAWTRLYRPLTVGRLVVVIAGWLVLVLPILMYGSWAADVIMSGERFARH